MPPQAENVEPMFRHTNVSRPEIHHSDSTRSVTASEDYYSLSSSGNSDDTLGQQPIKRYRTPPSRYRTPMASGDRLARDDSDLVTQQWQAPMRGPGRRRQSDPDRSSYPNPLQSNPRGGTINRKPIPSTVYEAQVAEGSRGPAPERTMSSAAKELGREPSPPTPDDDNTPYIHFALDQLTRDEEVRGSRMYPGLKSGPRIDRPISRDTVRPSYVSMSPEGFEDRPGNRSGMVSPLDSDADTEMWKAADSAGRIEAATPLAEDYVEPPVQQIPPKHPGRNSPRTPPQIQRPSSPEIFLPFDRSHAGILPTLDYLPGLLRPLALGSFLLILLFFLAALIFTAVWSVVNGQLWAYGSFADGRYFVFQYLPTILAVAIMIWLFDIEAAVFRIAPFLAFSSDSERTRSYAALLPIYPSSFALPTLTHFSSGQTAIGAFLLASWLSLFSVPLLSTAFNVYQDGNQWMWLATQGVIWVVIALYIILLGALIWLFFYLRHRPTGLKWDATNLTDLMSVLDQSNVLDAYAAYFQSPSVHDFRMDLQARGDRLGYWRTSKRQSAVFHTIAAPNLPIRRYRIDDGSRAEKPVYRLSDQSYDPEKGQRASHGTARSLIPKCSSTDPNPSPSRSYLPWFLTSITPFLLATTALLLLVACLVVSYLPSTTPLTGFRPLLSIPVNPTGFSAPNFLYSFIPSLLGLLVYLLLQNIDLTLRRLQPVADLLQPSPNTDASAAQASYTSSGPFSTPLTAAANGHWRVAVFSLVALTSATLPVLGGGVFWAQFYVSRQEVLISADRAAWIALTVFFALACLAMLALPFTRAQREKYAMPCEGLRRNEGRRVVDVVGLMKILGY